MLFCYLNQHLLVLIVNRIINIWSEQLKATIDMHSYSYVHITDPHLDFQWESLELTDHKLDDRVSATRITIPRKST